MHICPVNSLTFTRNWALFFGDFPPWGKYLARNLGLMFGRTRPEHVHFPFLWPQCKFIALETLFELTGAASIHI